MGGAMKKNMMRLLRVFICTLAIGQLSHAKDFKLNIFVSSEGNDRARGHRFDPIATLSEAQKRADHYIDRLEPNGANKNDSIYVNVYVAGVFECQTFQWKHSHQSVHLKIANTPGQAAEFNGHRQGCYDISEIKFFTAYGKSSDFKAYKGFSGFGTIKIQGLSIKHYGTGINISAWPDIKPGKIEISKNEFYKIGEIVSPGNWSPRFSAIELDNIDGAEVLDNRFIKVANLVETSLMHAVYFKNSDFGVVKGNHFENVSGPPLKFRNGSDKAIVDGNHFLRGEYSTHYYPIQNWYNNWWLSDAEAGEDRELPSIDIKVDNNTYAGGYLNYPINYDFNYRRSICVNRIVATPDILPESYIEAADLYNTNRRFLVRGQSVYGVHWAQLNCSEFNGISPDDLN